MGKAFCIHILTNGANEALWAKDVDDQNAWIDAITRACKKPEEPKAGPILVGGNSNNSASDIKIQVTMPGGPAGPDPNLAYQQALMEQQMQYQYQQQLAAYNQMLLQQQMQQQQPPLVTGQFVSTSNSSGSIPMMPFSGAGGVAAPYNGGAPMYGAPAAAPPQLYAPPQQVPPDFYTHASPAVSPVPSPQMARHSPPPAAQNNAGLSSVPSSGQVRRRR